MREYKPRITADHAERPTHLEEIELEDGLARQAKAAGEKIEAGSEERPYRANSAQGQGRSDLLL